MMLVSLFVLSAISSAKAKLESEPLSPGFELQALEKLLRIEMKLDDHSGEFETLKTRIEECAAAQNQISSTAENQKVFFKARLDTESAAIDANQVFIFKRLQHNQGNGYNSQSGKFTAPVSGMYQFTFYICPDTNNDAYYGPLHNGIFLVTGELFNREEQVCSSHTEIVPVQTGDTVWVQNKGGIAYKFWENDWHSNTFSGFLLQTF